MTDKTATHQDRLRNLLQSEGKDTGPENKDSEREEACCAAFGYLRGIHAASASVEFRLREGNSMWFPYGWLGPWQFNPSEGLLLKFSGDVVYLVLIRGSNLDKPLADGSINLTHAGLQRHRVLWIREMTNDEIERVGEAGPTVDSILIEEFASQDAPGVAEIPRTGVRAHGTLRGGNQAHRFSTCLPFGDPMLGASAPKIRRPARGTVSKTSLRKACQQGRRPRPGSENSTTPNGGSACSRLA
jgi:hypothetical protein